MTTFEERLRKLRRDEAALLELENRPIEDNGIFERDALVSYLVEQGILPFPSYTWQMVAVRFKG